MWNMQPELMFGDRVRELREEHGMSQAGLAARLGRLGVKIDPSAIARLEKGKRSIRIGEAVRIAEVFGVTAGAMIAPRVSLADLIRRTEVYRQECMRLAEDARAEADRAADRIEELRAQAQITYTVVSPPSASR